LPFFDTTFRTPDISAIFCRSGLLGSTGNTSDSLQRSTSILGLMTTFLRSKIDHPTKLNGLTPKMIRERANALTHFEKNEAARGAVLSAIAAMEAAVDSRSVVRKPQVAAFGIATARLQLAASSECRGAPYRPAGHAPFATSQGCQGAPPLPTLGGRTRVSKIGSRRTRKISRTPENSGCSDRGPPTQFSPFEFGKSPHGRARMDGAK
jgi:hypothetical protein